jgi:hypothetical protein
MHVPFSFDYGDMHFVVLDSSESQYGPMLTWLKKDLLAVGSPLVGHLNATHRLPKVVSTPPHLQRPRSRHPTWLIAIVHAAPYSKVCVWCVCVGGGVACCVAGVARAHGGSADCT